MKTAFKRFSEAWFACLTMMVQGNLFALTVDHALTAAKTGGLSAISFCVAAKFFKIEGQVFIAVVMGVLTAIADILIHPTHFGPAWGESAATGMAAALLCYIVERKLNK